MYGQIQQQYDSQGIKLIFPTRDSLLLKGLCIVVGLFSLGVPFFILKDFFKSEFSLLLIPFIIAFSVPMLVGLGIVLLMLGARTVIRVEGDQLVVGETIFGKGFFFKKKAPVKELKKINVILLVRRRGASFEQQMLPTAPGVLQFQFEGDKMISTGFFYTVGFLEKAVPYIQNLVGGYTSEKIEVEEKTLSEVSYERVEEADHERLLDYLEGEESLEVERASDDELVIHFPAYGFRGPALTFVAAGIVALVIFGVIFFMTINNAESSRSGFDKWGPLLILPLFLLIPLVFIKVGLNLAKREFRLTVRRGHVTIEDLSSNNKRVQLSGDRVTDIEPRSSIRVNNRDLWTLSLKTEQGNFNLGNTYDYDAMVAMRELIIDYLEGKKVQRES